MGYEYTKERENLFTAEGQVHFLKVRDQVQHLLKVAGAFRFDAVHVTGSSWTTIACVDRLVELKELVELPRQCWQQYRVFTTPEVHNL
jgi:hypothetical protein